MHRNWAQSGNSAGPTVIPFFDEIFMFDVGLWMYAYVHKYKKICDLYRGIDSSISTKKCVKYFPKLQNMVQLRGIFDLQVEFSIENWQECETVKGEKVRE